MYESLTSDEFFEQNTEVFDVIFIDGLHLSEQVYRDITNSLSCLSENGYIICHDMNPMEEIIQRYPQPIANSAWNATEAKNANDPFIVSIVFHTEDTKVINATAGIMKSTLQRYEKNNFIVEFIVIITEVSLLEFKHVRH